jgi:hypothetical protein
MYYESIGCTPFHYLYRRDPWAFALVAPALRATAKPLPNIEVSKAEDEDLDSNKEVLGPPPEENGNGQEAAKQKYNKEDNHSITLSALIASNKDRDEDHNNLSNIGDNSNWLLT